MKRIISAALVFAMIFALLTVGVSAAAVTGPTQQNPNLIYEWDFEDYTGGKPWNVHSGSKFYAGLWDGTNTTFAPTGSVKMAKTFGAVTSGKIYVSFDVGIPTGTTYVSGGEYGLDMFSTEIDSYPTSPSTGRLYTAPIRQVQDTTDTTKASGLSVYMPRGGFSTASSTYVVCEAGVMHRVDCIYEIGGALNVYVNGALLGSIDAPAVTAIAGIGLYATAAGVQFDNVKVATKPANSFTASLVESTSESFGIKFTESVPNLTTSNVTVNGVAAASVIKKDGNNYTVTTSAPVGGNVSIVFNDVKNFAGEDLATSTLTTTLPAIPTNFVNYVFDAKEAFDKVENTAESTVANIYEDAYGVVKVGDQNGAGAAERAEYTKSDGSTDYGLKLTHSKGTNDLYRIEFANPVYMLGTMTVEYSILADTNTKFFKFGMLSGGTTSESTYVAGATVRYTASGTGQVVGADHRGSWHTYKTVYDFDAGTVDIYVDGSATKAVTYAIDEFATINPNGTITGIRMDYQLTTPADGGTVIIDDIKVTSSYLTEDDGVYLRWYKMTKADGTDATTITPANGDVITVSANILNTNNTDTTACLLGGVYAGDVLTDGKFDNKTIGAKTAGNFTFDITWGSDTTSIKGYLWDSIANCKPIEGVLSTKASE